MENVRRSLKRTLGLLGLPAGGGADKFPGNEASAGLGRADETAELDVVDGPR